MEDASLETSINPKHQDVLPIHLSPDIQLALVLSTPLKTLTLPLTQLLTLLVSVQRGHRRSQKHLIQANLLMSLDIYFIIDNLHYNNINTKLPPYTLLRQKKFQDCWKKEYSKLCTLEICQFIYRFLTHNLSMKLKILVQIKLLRSLV